MLIIFGTPTATMPAWLARKYPDVLSQDYNGKISIFGGAKFLYPFATLMLLIAIIIMIPNFKEKQPIEHL